MFNIAGMGINERAAAETSKGGKAGKRVAKGLLNNWRLDGDEFVDQTHRNCRFSTDILLKPVKQTTPTLMRIRPSTAGGQESL